MIISSNVLAQDDPYRFSFAPDLWYNDVDGIRLGIRTLGEVEGTFKDGPHRLDAGIWFGTNLPDDPISYYLSFVEPIKSISEFGSEGSIQFVSSIRTGFTQHRIQLNKRWQSGFDEYDYKEVAVYLSQEKMFNSKYRAFPQLWQSNWKSLLAMQIRISKSPSIGHFLGLIDLKKNFNQQSGSFTVGTIELQQLIKLSNSFNLRIRGFAGFSSNSSAPEYLFMSSMNPAQTWIENGISRAKGTIPMPWLEAGSFQVGGGANLRGYVNREIDLLNSGFNPSSESSIGLNIELSFPNIIDNSFKDISVVGELISLRSYLFIDIGRQDFISPTNTIGNVTTNTPIIADGGLGVQFSVNIPDYLGKDRGIFIRYDIPFWLSDPLASESNFSFRQLIGVGAIISF